MVMPYVDYWASETCGMTYNIPLYAVSGFVQGLGSGSEVDNGWLLESDEQSKGAQQLKTGQHVLWLGPFIGA